MSIVMYGGSFDPPHLGHAQSAFEFLKRFPESKIFVVPAPQPAGIKDHHKNPKASYQDRLNMCELAFGPNKNPRLCVSTIESQLEAPNYTFKTLCMLKEKFPDKDLGLLLGQDQFESFHLWKDPKKILNLASLFVVSRKSKVQKPNDLRSLTNQIAENLREKLRWDLSEKIAEIEGFSGKIHLIDAQVSDAESTLIRECFGKGCAPPQTWLDSRVNEYILRHRLYQEPV